MAQSRNRKDHKEKLENFKNKQKMSEQKQPLPQQQLPPVREVPTWNPDELFTLTGREFELLYNYIVGVAHPYAAIQYAMNRALLEGKINMEFDKLVVNEDGSKDYIRMSQEEAAPHKADFARLVEAVKNPPTVPQNKPEMPSVNEDGLKAV